MEKRQVRHRVNRILDLYNLVKNVLIPEYNQALSNNKRNKAKSIEIQVKLHKENIKHQLESLQRHVCSNVFKVVYTINGQKTEAILTNIEEDEIELLLKLHFGSDYRFVEILEINRIPTFINIR